MLIARRKCDGMETAFERKERLTMDSNVVRIVCAVVAILFLGVIVLRRKKSAE